MGNLGEFINVSTYPLSGNLSSLPILNLANYGPGFPTDNKGGWWPPGKTDSLGSLLKYLNNPQPSITLPQNQPGTCYSYSNFGWGLLALAALGVSSASDHVLAEWASAISALGGAAGLKNTQPYESSILSSLPVGYTNGTMMPPGAHYGLSSMIFGAGDLVSTGDDMLNWLSYNMGRAGADNPMFREQQCRVWEWPKQCPPQPAHPVPVVSLAWFVHDVNTTDQRFLAKDGGLTGFTSWMGFLEWAATGVESPVGAFVLTNTANAASLGMHIMHLLLAVPAPPDLDVEAHAVTPEP